MRLLLTYTISFIAVSTLFSQTRANFIGNGSFEQRISNCSSIDLKSAKYWNSLDSVTNNTSFIFSYCNGKVPNQPNTIYQLPRIGNNFVGTTFYYFAGINNSRQYLKNRLKEKLSKNETYCVKFHVNIMNTSTLGSDGFGIYFGNNKIDTISQIYKPLTFLTPQVQSMSGVPIIDTLGWTSITGTFVATGDEKYALIGMFEPSGTMDTVILNPSMLPLNYTDACIDDVSCIPIDLLAYAGPNKSCVVGDSVFIGREPDVEIDESCIWYKLNTNGTLSTAIDTVAGLYVKPISTTTYVVRQQLWCSGVKWDTVVVYRDFVGLPNVSSIGIENSFQFYPNPATNKIYFEFKDELKIEKVSFINLLGQETLVVIDPKKEIDISFLSNGIYYLRLETNKGNKTFKLLKE